ncbi:HNH endonuclease [Leptospira wolffii]|uniref:HNH endonuclease n=1 Tax=Leptospira wolffii TaxID=409998 RepID=UPI00108235FD|nr:HNH endonuclease [Leptospira wolffii]TGL55686.1 HNH endonuclease [Leptospira wolffii]
MKDLIHKEIDMVDYCYLPGDDHSNDSSDEHIFPQSIGGIFKVRGLLCAKHNNEFGHTIDSALEKALRPYCVLLGLDSSIEIGGKYFESEIAGRKIRTDSNGRTTIAKPKFEKETDTLTGKTQIRIEAPNEEYLKKMLAQLTKKDPGLKEKITKGEKYKIELDIRDSQPKIEIPFFNVGLHKSIFKTLANYWIYKGGSREHIEMLLKAISGISTVPTSPYYGGPEIITGKPKHYILNSLVIVGSEKHQKLVGYVELLDAFRFIVQLQSPYIGPDIKYNYPEMVIGAGSIDDLTIDYNALLNFTNYDIAAGQIDNKSVSAAFNKLYFNMMQISEFNKAFNSSYEAALTEYNRTKNLNDFINVLSHKLVEQYAIKDGETQ